MDAGTQQTKLYFVADIGQTCFLFTCLYLSCSYIIEVLNELFAACKVEAFHGEFMRYTSFIDAVAYCIITNQHRRTLNGICPRFIILHFFIRVIHRCFHIYRSIAFSALQSELLVDTENVLYEFILSSSPQMKDTSMKVIPIIGNDKQCHNDSDMSGYPEARTDKEAI